MDRFLLYRTFGELEVGQTQRTRGRTITETDIVNWCALTGDWFYPHIDAVAAEKDTSNGEAAAGDGRPITMNGQVFTKGLGAHAASDIRYAVSGACARFKATVGIDDEKRPNGSVVFQVYADATKVYDSGVVTGTSAAKSVDVSTAGATELRLVGGYVHPAVTRARQVGCYAYQADGIGFSRTIVFTITAG